MDWLQKASSPLKNLYIIVTLTVLTFISACGGGGFDDTDPTGNGGTGGTDDEITIALALTSAVDGSTTETITSTTPGRITATVSGITSPVIVTFETSIGSIPTPTAITNGSNQATVDILAASALGAGTITASISTGESAELVFAVGATNLEMGSGSPFQPGVAGLGVAQISAGGTTTVSVSIVDDSGLPFTEPVDVNFSSACSSAATPTATLSSPVTTVNGVASSTYLAQGCVGNDGISVTANAGGINLSASATINVLSAEVGSIEFVSATPENIVIQGAGGAGGQESSTLVFRVRDTNGGKQNGRLVNFALNTNTGGIEMNPTSATSDINGLVQTVINSGTVSATVRVTATIDGSDPAISTQSSNLSVSTGIPDQDSFTLAASALNPEGWDIVGTEVEVTAFLADGFNNPVPDGTAVSFSTEGGRIDPNCTTVDGQCTVTWNSQNPFPEGATHGEAGQGPSTDNTYQADTNPFSLGQPYGGRATIIATVLGEESFPDSNGNGRFDASELTSFLDGTDNSGNPYDLDEAYTDYNEDGFFNNWETDPAEEPGGNNEILIDFDGDSSWTQKDSLYNGVLCSIPAHAGCSSQQSVHVRAQMVLVMSGSTAYLRLVSPENGVLTIPAGQSDGGSVIISDLHNQPMPAGTTINFSTSIGTLSGTSSYTMPSTNHNGGTAYSFTVKAPSQGGSGEVTVEVTTPSGLTTAFNPVSVIIE